MYAFLPLESKSGTPDAINVDYTIDAAELFWTVVIKRGDRDYGPLNRLHLRALQDALHFNSVSQIELRRALQQAKARFQYGLELEPLFEELFEERLYG